MGLTPLVDEAPAFNGIKRDRYPTDPPLLCIGSIIHTTNNRLPHFAPLA